MTVFTSVLFLLLLSFRRSFSAPGVQQALVYLSNYGYLEMNMMSNSPVKNAKMMKKSIKEFQNFIGLPMTGKLDRSTMKMMSMPRCGIKDKIGSRGRSKRYALQGSMWMVNNLKYRIARYPSKLKREDVDVTIRKAFDLWSEASKLTFEPSVNSSEKVHIEIMFVKGRHGDENPFEGPGGVLAHAYFPEFGGSAHFDESEPWVIESPDGTNLLQVANHEIGHSLGLSHSDEIEASMSPLYQDYIPNFMLHQDDVDAVQKIYMKKRKEKPILPLDPTEEEWMNWWDSFLD